MRLVGTLFISILFIAGCTPKELPTQEIINKTIDAYGGEKVFNSLIEFDFRDKHYTAKYHNYRFSLKRVFSDSTGHIIDELNNDGFTRLRNDSLITLDEEWTGKYSRSVNSVIYFFRVPFILNDEAVQPELIGTAELKGKSYYKIRVSFTEEGGGEDFDDTFVYWIDKETYFIDYLAYSYSTDGGGKRFREAINPREVNGFRAVDYINYEPKDLAIAIEDYDTYFHKGGMKELSRIINENVSIEYLD
jgi:hypothetical protein